MANYFEMTRDELAAEKAALEEEYKKFQAMGLKLNMARGKPGPHQMDLAMGLLQMTDYTTDAGTDARNYGDLEGLHEARELFADVMGVKPEEVFVGGHPMAGSEKTGYDNSTDHLLENAYYMITPTEKSTPEQIGRIRRVALSIGAIPMVTDYRQHDFSVAAVSHLPHLVASSLVNLVRDNDNEEELMRTIAAGGFKDITRIASSSPVMWEQICMTNTENIKVLLRRYIQSLETIYEELDRRDGSSIHRLFEESGAYRNTFSSHSRGPVAPDYSFTVDIVDEPGSISTLAVLLASKGINIKNIGINHSREEGEGALRISFYNQDSETRAYDLLKKYNYTLIK